MNALVIIAVLFAFFTIDVALASDCEDGLTSREFSHHFRIVRTPRPGLEPSREIQVGLGAGKASITLAMRQPSAQISPLNIQVFANQLNAEEGALTFLVAQISEVVPGTQLAAKRHGFVRLTSSPVHRDELDSAVREIKKRLERRFSSNSNVYPDLARATRARDPAVSHAAKGILDFLRRHRVTDDLEAERVLNIAHSRLINALDEHELRFFDYELFTEVLNYETSLKMQNLSDSIKHTVGSENANFELIHQRIRNKFILIVKDLAREKNAKRERSRAEIQKRIDSLLIESQRYLSILDKAKKSKIDLQSDYIPNSEGQMLLLISALKGIYLSGTKQIP